MFPAMVPYSTSDATARAALALDGNYGGLNMTGTAGTGTANRIAFAAFLASYSSGATVRLPSGTLLIAGDGDSGNYITFPAGVRIIGHEKGTTLKFTAPSGSHSPFRLSSNLTLEDITFQWDMSSHPAAAADCSLVFGNGFAGTVDNVTMRRCKFFGDADTAVTAVGGQLYWLGNVMPITLWQCTNIVMEECEVARSTGTNYGLNIIGGTDHVYRNCYFHHNAADGVKLMGNSSVSTVGQPARMRFIGCRGDYNGQVIMQGQTIYTNTYTTGTTITPVNGARYLVNGTFNLTLNDGTEGDRILISHLIGSGTCTIKKADGTTTVVAITSAYDRWCVDLKFTSGSWGVNATTLTNGEGWDIVGKEITFSHCTANGNEGPGFQIKPSTVGAIGYNTCAGIIFDSCVATNGWASNGFGVVNNITDTVPREMSPQDITFAHCIASGNYANGFIVSSSALPNYGITFTHCVSRNNGGDGIGIQGYTRNAIIHGCRCEGNGSSAGVGLGWNLKLGGAKGIRITDCYFSGVDPVSQSLALESAVNDNANARCYGMLIDKAKNGTMKDVYIVNCRFHNHLATNGNRTDIRFYNNDAVVTSGGDYDQTVASSRLLLGTASLGMLSFSGQQDATLGNSSTGTNDIVTLAYT